MTVKKTSAQSKNVASRKARTDCADPTSTTPIGNPKRKVLGGVVDPTSAQPIRPAKRKMADGCADPTSTAPTAKSKSKSPLGAVDSTSAQPSSLAKRNRRDGYADPTSTAPNPKSKRSRTYGVVDLTSAQPNVEASRKNRAGCADQTSTAPNRPASCKTVSGAVDSTSAQPIPAMKRNGIIGCADPTSIAPNKVSQSNFAGDAVDQTSAQPIRSAKRKMADGCADQTSTAPSTPSKSNCLDGAVDQPFLADPILGVMACTVDDLEAVRTASENRLRALTSEHGLTLQHPDVARQAAMLAQLNIKSKLLENLGFNTEGLPKGLEQEAILNMNRVVRRHPLWAFMKPIAGVGEKQFARLLAVIGDPYWNDLHDRPRTMRELRAYCGWHVVGTGYADKTNGDRPDKSNGVGVAPKRQRGQQSNWNDEARKRVWLIAESCMKQRTSIYRDVYDNARKQYDGTTHPAVCVRCGPKGKPAQPGTPRSAGHQHAMALRKVAVAFLADVWRESRRLHEQPAANHTGATQPHPRRQAKPRNMIGA